MKLKKIKQLHYFWLLTLNISLNIFCQVSWAQSLKNFTYSNNTSNNTSNSSTNNNSVTNFVSVTQKDKWTTVDQGFQFPLSNSFSSLSKNPIKESNNLNLIDKIINNFGKDKLKNTINAFYRNFCNCSNLVPATHQFVTDLNDNNFMLHYPVYEENEKKTNIHNVKVSYQIKYLKNNYISLEFENKYNFLLLQAIKMLTLVSKQTSRAIYQKTIFLIKSVPEKSLQIYAKATFYGNVEKTTADHQIHDIHNGIYEMIQMIDRE